ncbi:ABC transporter ATP-binding protein [Aurantiacibacter suaedae]|uniref:ABC transporter ATP-binding protein n=1 Tax=Aurantiacibacter suaedae TaxID=2545755 RepID=UPI0010F68948|nr:ABC transporter ATP-binding protein [Aurantiacibacter suaedae]
MELSTRVVTVMRGDHAALSQVSLALKPGELVAICGPNGAGKSTLLSALSGLEMPELGAVFLGKDLLQMIAPRERAMQIGYLPQTGEIAWDMAVARLVSLGRLPQGDSERANGLAAIENALATCDLTAFTERSVSSLSGGERARVLLARVLAGEPRWLLADEPLAALDLAHQLRLLRVLRGVADEGRGVVLVLHDLALAMNHTDRVIVLHDGHVAADGKPEHALSSKVLADVWGVDARWIGEPDQRALTIRR